MNDAFNESTLLWPEVYLDVYLSSVNTTGYDSSFQSLTIVYFLTLEESFYVHIIDT